MGVDPLGGAGVHYWPLIADQYKLDLTVTNDAVDPTFRFMTLDWDGKIRMDPSSPNAMQRLIGLKDRFDIAFACDTDHDRHGVVTRSAGLMPPNHYLTAAAHYLFSNRPKWSTKATIGKTVVTSMMLDKVAAQLGRKIYRDAGGLQMVCRRSRRWLAGFRVRGERGRLAAAPRRQRVDHRQGWHHAGAARR